MILFFSGTGNSEYAAKRIGKTINDDAVNLFEKIPQPRFFTAALNRPWVIVVPTYAWRIPRIVQEWLENTKLTGNRSIYFVMTCGGSIGNAGAYLEKLCNAKKLDYCGCMEVVCRKTILRCIPRRHRPRRGRLSGGREKYWMRPPF